MGSVLVNSTAIAHIEHGAVEEHVGAGYFVAATNSHVHNQLAIRIKAGFAKHYDAEVNEFMPLLACLGYSEQRYCCFGLRSAAGPLFLSQYLSQPLSAYLEQWGCNAAQCVELGNLVSTHSQATLAHFVVLAKALHEANKKKLVFCATGHIRTLLSRVGAHFTELEAAKPERLQGASSSWGSYYAHTPVVCVVDVEQVSRHVDKVDTLSFFANAYAQDIINLSKEVARL
ncbi:thermostable hemolysin [Pseudoalteromonas sp. SSDWG2]|uniref:thermostable hemolysin n=1 Tax=Pseudoalteromonas sp. SSDWG2 TaxID=3139391 RepID=UPI003BAD4E99